MTRTPKKTVFGLMVMNVFERLTNWLTRRMGVYEQDSVAERQRVRNHFNGMRVVTEGCTNWDAKQLQSQFKREPKSPFA